MTPERNNRPQGCCVELPDLRMGEAGIRRLLLGTMIYVLALAMLMLF